MLKKATKADSKTIKPAVVECAADGSSGLGSP